MRFELPGAASVSLAIYDVAGRRVRILVDERMPAGRHSVMWDGRDQRGLGVSSGIYFYRLRAKGFGDSRKMLLLK